MAGPGGAEIGRLSIRVTADTSGMKEKIRREAKLAGKDVRIEVEADTDKFIAEVVAAKKAVAERPVYIEVDALVNPAMFKRRTREAIDEAAEELDFDITPDLGSTSAFERKLARFMSRTRNNVLSVGVELNTDSVALLEENIRRLQARIIPTQIGALSQGQKFLDQDADYRLVDEIKAAVESARRMLDQDEEIRRIQVDLDANTASFERHLREATTATESYFDKLDSNMRKHRIRQLQIQQSDRLYMEALDRRTRRLSLWTDVFREKIAIVGVGTAVSGLTATVSLLAGYLGAAAGQAVALAGGLVQAAGAAAMLPGLLAGTAASIGVLVIGMQGFGEAVKVLLDDEASPEAVAEALEGLSPAARDAAKAVAGLKPAFSDLKRGIQESLFVGLDGAIGRLSDFAVAMRPSLMSIAAGWNSVFGAILGGVTSEQSVSGFSETFERFGKMMSLFSTGIPAAIRGLAGMSEASSRFFELFGVWGADKLRYFEGWVARIASDGSFERWINNARMALGDLGGIVRNVAGGLSGMFAVSGSQAFLSQLRSMTKEFEAWATSASGAEALFDFFAQSRTMISSVHGVVKQLGPVFRELWGGISGFTRTFASAFPDAMAQAGDAAASFAQALEGLGGPMARIVGSALTEVGELAGTLGPSLARLGDSIAPFIREVADFAAGAGGVFVNTLTATLEIANKMMEVFPGLAQVLGAAFAVRHIMNFTETFNAALVGTFPALQGLMGNAKGADGSVRQLGIGAAMARKELVTFRDVTSTLGRVASNALPFAAAAVAAWGLAQTLHDSLNPRLIEFQEHLKSMPGRMDALTQSVESGSMTAASALKAHAAAWDELRSAQAKAADEAGSGNWFENMFAGMFALNKVTEDALRSGRSIGEVFSGTALKFQLQNLPELTKAQAEYNEAQLQAIKVAEQYGEGSKQHLAALSALDAATWRLAKAKEAEAAATKTAGERAKEQLQAQLTLTAAQGDAAQAQLNVNSAAENYNETLKEFGAGSLEATAALGQLDQALSIAVTSIGKVAHDQAVANGATDGTTKAFQAQIAYLDELINAQGVHSEAAKVQKSLLLDTQAASMVTGEAFAALAGQIHSVPDDKTIIVNDTSGEVAAKLRALGLQVEQLPDGQIKVTATDNATPAAKSIAAGIGQLTASIKVTSQYIGGFGAGKLGTADWGWGKRDGGYIDRGSHPRVDDVPTLLAKGEYVLHAGAVKALGVDFLNELNSIGKTSGARTASQIRGKFADGGSTDDWFERALRRVNSGGMQASMNTPVSARAQAAPVGGNTFILPPVDPYSMAREVNRLNGREVDLL